MPAAPPRAGGFAAPATAATVVAVGCGVDGCMVVVACGVCVLFACGVFVVTGVTGVAVLVAVLTGVLVLVAVGTGVLVLVGDVAVWLTCGVSVTCAV